MPGCIAQPMCSATTRERMPSRLGAASTGWSRRCANTATARHVGFRHRPLHQGHPKLPTYAASTASATRRFTRGGPSMAAWRCRTRAAERVGGGERQAQEAAGGIHARRVDLEGDAGKKLLTPGWRRSVAIWAELPKVPRAKRVEWQRRETAAERLRRKLQRPVPGRMPQRTPVQQPGRDTPDHRSMEG